MPKFDTFRVWESYVGSQSPLEFMQESTGKRKKVFTRDEVRSATRKYADVDELSRMYKMPKSDILDDVRDVCGNSSLTKAEASDCLADFLEREIESEVTIRTVRKKK